MMRKLFLALMAVAAIAMTGTFTGCEKDPNNPEPPENVVPPEEYDVTQGRTWEFAPERIPLTVTSTENDEE